MYEEKTAGFVGQGPFDYLADVHDGLIYCPALETLCSHDRVLGIHEGHVDFFLRQSLQLGLKIGTRLAS